MNKISKLIVGKKDTCLIYIKDDIKKSLPGKDHKLIDLMSHQNILYLKPSSDFYINDDLDMLFEQTKYIRDLFFIIIEQVDKLNENTANKLLKIIEEPPKNYYFLLTTQHVTNVLATVRSRCLEIYLDLEKTKSNFIDDNIETELEKLFRDAINNKVDAYKINQLEKVVTHEEINQAIWAVIKNKPEVFEKLKFYLKNPFMPGSSKIALKSIYAALLNI